MGRYRGSEGTIVAGGTCAFLYVVGMDCCSDARFNRPLVEASYDRGLEKGSGEWHF